MERQTNDEVEFNAEVNYVATYDNITITNEKYLIPPHPTQVFQQNKARVKELNDLLIYKGNPASSNKDALSENSKEVIEYAETLTVEYSSEIVDATVVTNEVNKIQNDVPPIARVVING